MSRATLQNKPVCTQMNAFFYMLNPNMAMEVWISKKMFKKMKISTCRLLLTLAWRGLYNQGGLLRFGLVGPCRWKFEHIPVHKYKYIFFYRQVTHTKFSDFRLNLKPKTNQFSWNFLFLYNFLMKIIIICWNSPHFGTNCWKFWKMDRSYIKLCKEKGVIVISVMMFFLLVYGSSLYPLL